MGNRAVITTAPFNEDALGIYIHWNGGQESIEGFLAAAKELGHRPPATDESYATARLVQIIANYFGGTTSIGIGINRNLDCDNGDNGVWLIGGDWELLGQPARKRRALSKSAQKTAKAIAAECVAKSVQFID